MFAVSTFNIIPLLISSRPPVVYTNAMVSCYTGFTLPQSSASFIDSLQTNAASSYLWCFQLFLLIMNHISCLYGLKELLRLSLNGYTALYLELSTVDRNLLLLANLFTIFASLFVNFFLFKADPLLAQCKRFSMLRWSSFVFIFMT